MAVEDLIGSVIQGALLGGRKRSHGARRFLHSGGSPFLTASTLLTVGGLVWGAIETMQQQSASQPAPGGATAPPLRPAAPGVLEVPPPLPGTTPAAADVAGTPAEVRVPEGAAKLVRLTISAARADGTLDEKERQAILEHARAAGAEVLVEGELRNPTALAAIVDGVTDPQQRRDLYVLAYSIVRADETVSGSERIYLAQLASLLGLEPGVVDDLEAEAARGIAAEGARGGDASGGGEPEK